jgi:hypothetical protein
LLTPQIRPPKEGMCPPAQAGLIITCIDASFV